MSYVEYFLNSKSSVVQLECLTIGHPLFSKQYRIVRNATKGIWIQDGGSFFYEYYPLRITGNSLREDLDFGLTVELGDLGEVIPTEIDAIVQAEDAIRKPWCIYRCYRSDDLTKPIFGPIDLEITNFAFNREGCRFEAVAPSLNINGTGETYKLDRFQTLRGFL